MQLVAVSVLFMPVGVGIGTVSACGGKLGDGLSGGLRALGLYGIEGRERWSGAFMWATFTFGLRDGGCRTALCCWQYYRRGLWFNGRLTDHNRGAVTTNGTDIMSSKCGLHHGWVYFVGDVGDVVFVVFGELCKCRAECRFAG